MKILSFIVLSYVSFSTFAIELYSCTDETGKTHYTNLPKNSLDSNCKAKDQYAVMLQQDYDNLSHIYSKYESEAEQDDFYENTSTEPFQFSETDFSSDSIKNKVTDIFDADKALEELMEATEDRDDVFTRAIRGRTKGVKDIIEQGNTN